MARQRLGGSGGTAFHHPLQTYRKLPGAISTIRGDVFGHHIPSEYYYYEDFLWDEFDIAKHPLAIYDASASGIVTTDLVDDAVGGQFQVKLASTSEAETAGLTMGGNLYIRGNLPFYFETRLKIVLAPAANQVYVFGLASDINTNVFDDVVRHAWFRVETDADIMVEVDDNVTNTDDKDTNVDVVTDAFIYYSIERTFDGRVIFAMAEADGDAYGSSYIVPAADAAFGANNLQPVLLAQKASGATQPEIVIDYIFFCGTRL